MARIVKGVAIGWGVLACVWSAAAQYGQYSSRSLLEKRIYYVSDGKIGECKFWSLYLGDHQCKVPKYFAGEGDVLLNANVNYNLLSSGYIDGSGYSSRGKVGVDGRFAFADGDSLTPLPLDSIDYVYYYGGRVKPVGKDETDLILHTGGINRLKVKRLLLRKFVYDKTYGELKPDEDVPIQAFSFSQAGAAQALAAQKRAEREEQE